MLNKKIWIFWIILIFALNTAYASDWPMFGHDLTHTGTTDEVVEPPLELIWKFQAGGFASSPTVFNGTVYIGSYDNYVYALDANSGNITWKFKTGGEIYSSPTVAGSIIFIGSQDNYFYAIDAVSGELKWKYQTGPIYSSPTVSNGSVYIGSSGTQNKITGARDSNAFFYSMDASTGEPKWKYSFNKGIVILGSPAISNDIVYFSAEEYYGKMVENVWVTEAYIYAIDSNNGKLKWMHETEPGGITSSPAISNGYVFVGAYGPRVTNPGSTTQINQVIAFNALNGDVKWIFNTSGTVAYSSPIVSNDTIFIGSRENVYALNKNTGELRWKWKYNNELLEIRSIFAISGNTVYVRARSFLYAFDKLNGAKKWEYKIWTNSDTTSPAISDDIIYITGAIIGSPGEYVFAFKPVKSSLNDIGATMSTNSASSPKSTPNLGQKDTQQDSASNSSNNIVIWIILFAIILYTGNYFLKSKNKYDTIERTPTPEKSGGLDTKQSQETDLQLFEERIINVQELSVEEYERIKPFIKETKYGLINYSIFDSYDDAINCQKPISLNGSPYKGEGTHIKDIVKLPDGRFAFVSPTIRQRAGITYGTFVKHEFKPVDLKNFDIQRGYSVLSNNDIKFGIRLTNNSNFMIADADVILDYAKNLFTLKDSPLQNIGNITPISTRTATYLLKPLGCIHNEQINALITYKDHTGKKQTLHMRPKEVHCVCPFLKEKPMSEGEYSRLAESSEFVQEGISFKGISIEDLAKFIGETCRHMLYRVREYDVEGKKVIYLSGESLGEKAYYLMTAVIQEYKGLTQVVLRAYSDKKHGLNGFMKEMAGNIRHLVGSVQNAREIGIIENTQVINIIDSVVQRTSFEMGESGSARVNIKDSVVQLSNPKNIEEK